MMNQTNVVTGFLASYENRNCPSLNSQLENVLNSPLQSKNHFSYIPLPSHYGPVSSVLKCLDLESDACSNCLQHPSSSVDKSFTSISLQNNSCSICLNCQKSGAETQTKYPLLVPLTLKTSMPLRPSFLPTYHPQIDANIRQRYDAIPRASMMPNIRLSQPIASQFRLPEITSTKSGTQLQRILPKLTTEPNLEYQRRVAMTNVKLSPIARDPLTDEASQKTS